MSNGAFDITIGSVSSLWDFKSEEHKVPSKKKIAAVICTALLATAGVINYVKTDNYTAVNLDIPKAQDEYDEDTIYGEAKYVNTDEKEEVQEPKEIPYEEDEDLSIEKSRSEAVSLLKSVAESETASADKKAEAQSEIIRIANDMEKEAVVKEILKKKGYEDVSVYLNSPGATVSVKSEGLSNEDLAKIRDVLKDEGEILPQNLKIIETK